MRAILVAWCMLLVAGFGLRAEVPPVQAVTLAWDYAAPTGMVFRVKDRVGPVTNIVAVVTGATQVTLTNVLAGPHDWSVTASNMWGESDPSVPFVTPAKPVTPTNLKPISTTFKVQTPASFEKTQDLISWEERFRLFKPDSNGVQVVMQTLQPGEPFAFYRYRPTALPLVPR